jgi:hypothetical protein
MEKPYQQVGYRFQYLIIYVIHSEFWLMIFIIILAFNEIDFSANINNNNNKHEC